MVIATGTALAAVLVTLRIEALTDLGPLASGLGAGLQVLVEKVPLMAVSPEAGTPDAAVGLARWYLGLAAVSIGSWLTAGWLWLRAERARQRGRSRGDARHTR
jgi:hypothetical protein